ncbi:MAG: DUF5990 family protein [Bryobacteraceae bacterium]
MPQRITIPVRITLIDPPPGVMFCLQDRSLARSSPTLSTGADVSFELFIELDANAGVHGRFAMGPPGKRFVYVCSGTMAGQTDTRWTRRAKIPLTGLPFGLTAGDRLEAVIGGRARDGGPACATVPLLNGGWQRAG